MTELLADLRHLLEMPEAYEPTYADLLEAVEASCIWAIAEHDNLGTFHQKMGLRDYAEWCCDKALGRPHDEEWRGVPQIVIDLKSIRP